jgi:NAD(P)-dependent dehydrogenase (short-subunit alcohol dehydrogenase family)
MTTAAATRPARFQDRVVLIFGGNSGIGLASAIAFADEGARVVITGRDTNTLADAERTIGRGAVAIQADIADLRATDAVMAHMAKAHGRIDVLFVNAGLGRFVPLEHVTEEQWDHTVGVNLKGPYFAVQKALPLMQPGSSIVLTSSIGHCKGIPGNSVYAASKAGLRALARNFGAELVSRGIRVNCISPGPIDTPIFNRSGIPESEMAGMRENIRNNIPMKRFGTSEEVATAVTFLASSDAAFITGIDLLVDGGAVSF